MLVSVPLENPRGGRHQRRWRCRRRCCGQPIPSRRAGGGRLVPWLVAPDALRRLRPYWPVIPAAVVGGLIPLFGLVGAALLSTFLPFLGLGAVFVLPVSVVGMFYAAERRRAFVAAATAAVAGLANRFQPAVDAIATFES